MRASNIELAVLVVVAVCVVVFAGLFDFVPATEAQNRSGLFVLKSSPEAKTGDEKNSPASVRESDIEVNLGNLAESNSNPLTFPLFDGKSYTAVRKKSEGFESRSPGNFTWRGKLIAKNFEGDVVLTSTSGFLTGMIYSPDAVYEIVAKGNRQILVQLEQGLFPECGGEIKPPSDQKNPTPPEFGSVEDSGDRIDVLVVYTNATKNALGGDAQAQALAQSAIDITNTAYINSKIRQRVRLIHSAETALTEANSISELRADAATQSLRNTHNADMVAMLVNSLSGCGLGYVMTSVNTGFAPSAYSITLRTCAVGNLTFAHELGHNMGSAHNPENAGSSAYSYSFGHYVNGSYRTVMSYSNPCTSGCTRVPQFSNPSIIFNSVPTGILNERNNTRSIENTADTVSNFRYSGNSLRLDNFSQDASIPRNISRDLNWSTNGVAGNVKIEFSSDEGSSWQTLIANTPNDGSESISVNSRPTKRVRIRISSVNDASISDSSVRNLRIK